MHMCLCESLHTEMINQSFFFKENYVFNPKQLESN